MTNTMVDQRIAKRYPLTLFAEVREPFGTAVLDALASEISLNGCYIDTPSPCALGTEVKVRLRQGSELFEMGATVAYVCPGLGMGLQWANPLLENLAVLNDWLGALR